MKRSWLGTRPLTRLLLLGALGTGCVRAESPAASSTFVVRDGLPDIPARILERVNTYQEFPAAYFSAWDPDSDGMLLEVRQGGKPLNRFLPRAGGTAVSLAGGNMDGPPVFHPQPGSRNAVFSKDQDGNEQFQLYLFHLDTGATTLLTDGTSRHEDPHWSPDGTKLFFTTTARNGKDLDVAMVDLRTPGRVERLTEAAGYWILDDVSPDGRRLAVRRFISINESYLSTVDVATKRRTDHTFSDRPVARQDARFGPDGNSVFYISNEWGGSRKIGFIRLTSNVSECLTPTLTWDVDHLALSPDGRSLAFTTNEEGMSRLYLMDLKTRTAQMIQGLPVGVIQRLGFDRHGARLALSMNTYQTPGDVYVVTVASRALTRWTASESAAVPADALAAPSLIRYPTFDRVDGQPRTIPAFYYKPLDTRRSSLPAGKCPVVILIHGGPEIQERASFNPTCQYLMRELGVAVITPNVRGSDGYGRDYLNLDNGLKREDAVKDIGALLAWIQRQPELDASRVAVMGGSYGGYLSLASMVHFSDRLACGVDAVGISNFVTYFERTAPYRRDLRRAEYGDERDPRVKQFFEATAPVNNAAKITKPLLIVHGANDPRVPVEESEQIVKAVRANGQSAWLLIFKNEGHGRPALGFGRFHHPDNDLLYSAALIHFLEQFLLGPRPNK